ncbi:MAG: hypoxanthine phosphoribosyltransferase [Oscillospiraceae bacterium]|jgi:hypoxanthine phosphoribosyltransferase|nr:hypoxanthine phosphoribosyltransferase [Oscillospiraceae bacterium]
MMNDIERVLFNEECLKNAVNEIGRKISSDYRDKNLLMVSILKGSVVFMSDLIRAISIHCMVDFMCVSSYGSGPKTSGVVKILKDLDIEIAGYDVLIVEDILDSGITLSYIMELIRARNPASIRICTLFDKPVKRDVAIKLDYKGLEVPDEFIVGYGLDYNEKYRNLRFVGVLKPKIYDKQNRGSL